MKIMYFYSSSVKGKLYKKIFISFIIIIMIFLLTIWIIGMKNIINKYALNKLEYLVTIIIDESVSNSFNKLDINSDDLLIITKNDSGDIKSISIDPYYANLLKSEISKEITERVNEISNDDLEITLGMLVGHFGLGSWGPNLPFTVSPNGNVSIDFNNSFICCGINQVQDNLNIDVNVDVSAMMPFYNFKSQIHSTVLVSQTVIIGDVPDSYFKIEEKTNDR